MDIREFNKLDNLPEELYNLDILDGSPPCTTFSMAGEREESWGKKKKFREGQAEQTLDDLSFVFIETVAKLKPKCVIMENVEGLIKGEAWIYVQKIYKQLHDIGYKVKHWLLKGQHMGVPQTRHRVFFVALRNDVKFDPTDLDMSFNYEPINYGTIKSGAGDEMNKATRIYNLLCQAEENDRYLSDVVKRVEGKESLFNYVILQDHFMFPTLSAGSAVTPMRGKEKNYCTCEDMIHSQTFPEDYDFLNRSRANVQYICGMSVPPIMIKRIVTRLIESGVFDNDKVHH
jgi:DNA (cytosine-5)-methyltransferase 1